MFTKALFTETQWQLLCQLAGIVSPTTTTRATNYAFAVQRITNHAPQPAPHTPHPHTPPPAHTTGSLVQALAPLTTALRDILGTDANLPRRRSDHLRTRIIYKKSPRHLQHAVELSREPIIHLHRPHLIVYLRDRHLQGASPLAQRRHRLPHL